MMGFWLLNGIICLALLLLSVKYEFASILLILYGLVLLVLVVRAIFKGAAGKNSETKPTEKNECSAYTEDDWSAAVNRDAEAMDRWSKEHSHGKK